MRARSVAGAVLATTVAFGGSNAVATESVRAVGAGSRADYSLAIATTPAADRRVGNVVLTAPESRTFIRGSVHCATTVTRGDGALVLHGHSVQFAFPEGSALALTFTIVDRPDGPDEIGVGYREVYPGEPLCAADLETEPITSGDFVVSA